MEAQEASIPLDDTSAWWQWMAVLSLLAFFAPLFVSGHQWLTGTLVNCLLFLAGIVLRRSHRWSVILLPSVGAVMNGVLFGAFTPFLLFLVPFIWAGNALLVESFLAVLERAPAAVAVAVSAAAKASLLFICAWLLHSMGIVPQMFVTAMGVLQLVTALAGGALAYLVLSIARIQY